MSSIALSNLHEDSQGGSEDSWGLERSLAELAKE